MISKLYYGPVLVVTDLLWASYDLSALSRAGRSPRGHLSDVPEGSGILLNRRPSGQMGDAARFRSLLEEL